jgi:hypothetical protein
MINLFLNPVFTIFLFTLLYHHSLLPQIPLHLPYPLHLSCATVLFPQTSVHQTPFSSIDLLARLIDLVHLPFQTPSENILETR